MNSKLLQTILRKMLRILSHNHVGARHNRRRHYMSVILVGNTFDRPHQFKGNAHHRIRKSFFHSLPSPGGLSRGAMKFCLQHSPSPPVSVRSTKGDTWPALPLSVARDRTATWGPER